MVIKEEGVKGFHGKRSACLGKPSRFRRQLWGDVPVRHFRAKKTIERDVGDG